MRRNVWAYNQRMTRPETQPIPVAHAATVRGVPQNRGIIQPPDQSLIRQALTEQQQAAEVSAAKDEKVRAAVLTAVEHGSSVRELAAFTGLSTNTISRWKREGR